MNKGLTKIVLHAVLGNKISLKIKLLKDMMTSYYKQSPLIHSPSL